MTRMDFVVKLYKESLISDSCPGAKTGIQSMPNFEERTHTEDNEGNVIGCRGITCEQCWNKKIEE